MADYPKIVVRPPGPKARELAKRDERVISQSFVRFYPLAIEGGSGCILHDVDGNDYIDFNSGLVCLNVGHNHPKVVEAIKKQTERYLHYSNTDFLYPEVVDLAEELTKLTPGNWEKRVFFGNSGAESVEGAAKLARWHGPWWRWLPARRLARRRRHRHQPHLRGLHARTSVRTGRDFMRRHRDRPFLLHLAPSPPHMPIASLPEPYKSMYRPDAIPQRSNVWKNGQLPFDER